MSRQPRLDVQVIVDRYRRTVFSVIKHTVNDWIAEASAGLLLNSNRSPCALDLTFSISITYGQRTNKRWDSTDLRYKIDRLARTTKSAHGHPFFREAP